MNKTTFDQFRLEVNDIDIPESELAKYFLEDDSELANAAGAGPVIRINTEEVELEDATDPRTEAAVLFGFANNVSRWRRLQKYHRSIEKSDLPILVTEGDSWFQFPILLDDVVDNLSKDFSVYSMGAAGDTTRNMIFESPEFLLGIREAEKAANKRAAGFVFSSGGNDILGKVDNSEDRVLAKIVRKHQTGESFSIENAYDEEQLDLKMRFLRAGYKRLIADIRAVHPNLPLFFHSYDKVWPFDNTNPADKRKGTWVQPPLTAQGVTNINDQRAITNDLISRFRDMLINITNEDRHAHFMDTGQPLANRLDLWHDEIHPNNEGYKIVSEKFAESINQHISVPA